MFRLDFQRLEIVRQIKQHFKTETLGNTKRFQVGKEGKLGIEVYEPIVCGVKFPQIFENHFLWEEICSHINTVPLCEEFERFLNNGEIFLHRLCFQELVALFQATNSTVFSSLRILIGEEFKERLKMEERKIVLENAKKCQHKKLSKWLLLQRCNFDNNSDFSFNDSSPTSLHNLEERLYWDLFGAPVYVNHLLLIIFSV